MLPISIYSAALACLAKEQEKPPTTWPNFGQADFWKVEVKQILQVLLHLSTLGNTPHIQIYQEHLKKHPRPWQLIEKNGWEMMYMINLLTLVALK